MYLEIKLKIHYLVFRRENMLKCDLITCYTNQIEIFEVDRILEYFFIHKNKNFYKHFKQYLPKNYIH